jgi:Xaa-Pro aminopeptidase
MNGYLEWRMNKRRQRCREIINSYCADGALISNIEDIRYFSGFTGSDAVIILLKEKGFFLTDSRYTTQAVEEISGLEIISYEKKAKGVLDLIIEKGLKRVIYDPRHMSMELYMELQGGFLNIEWIPVKEPLWQLRIRKEPEEITLIEKAISIATESFKEILKDVKRGRKEKEIAWDLEVSLRTRGADQVSFDIIVASGARSALPHGRATEKSLMEGEFVVIDYGCRYMGYHSDETCTIVIGRPDKKQEEVYRIVKEAHDRAIDSVRPGVEKKKIDSAARDTISRAGYGKYFGHGTGHGIGLSVHEEPIISPNSEGIVEGGMVFTIEPGIYIPGWGGVRIEDIVLVESNGARVLTFMPKDMIIL